MFINGSLLKEMQKVIYDAAVLVIDENDNAIDGDIPVYTDPDRWNYGPVIDATAAQQKIIMLAQAYNRPIFLVQNGFCNDPGCYFDEDDITRYAMDTRLALRVLLPTNTRVINKQNPNAFVDTGLAGILEQDRIKNLVVMGYHANVCVRATIGINTPTKRYYRKGPGAIQHNLTVLTGHAVLNGHADWFIHCKRDIDITYCSRI